MIAAAPADIDPHIVWAVLASAFALVILIAILAIENGKNR